VTPLPTDCVCYVNVFVFDLSTGRGIRIGTRQALSGGPTRPDLSPLGEVAERSEAGEG